MVGRGLKHSIAHVKSVTASLRLDPKRLQFSFWLKAGSKLNSGQVAEGFIV